MFDFTIKDIYDRVIELGQEDPDFIYTDQVHYENDCFYLGADEEENGRPCIVGQAMIDLGADKDRMRTFNNNPADLYIKDYLSIDDVDLSFQDYSYLARLKRIQKNQDAGFSWGLATSAALPTLDY